MTRSSRSLMAANRKKILAAAMDLFRARGAAAVGIAEVMHRAGMTQGGFYKHFVSKDALAAAACAAAFAEAEHAWRSVVTEGQDEAAERLRTFYLRPRPAERTCPILSFAADVRNAPDTLLATEWRAGILRLVALYGELAGLPPDAARVAVASLAGARLLGFGGALLDDRDAAASFLDETAASPHARPEGQ
ncbi:TetR family transcriptional regulator [Haematobacter massiliensis]|uniref:TetR family transcriptional regulator n=1 Tax=Haematobacter massiliensis TaxID=195105 RepID=A0A086Y325_9RHOB|nr:TetR/AcrR family transcriptional regulator [Haematobacter massiliensis]KFI28675.1 TetR family transcriptional regulator [Haematobacter massiliensis]